MTVLSSGALLAVLGLPCLGDASSPLLPLSFRGVLPVCVSVSKFPLFIRTLVILGEGPP